jgi:hypothetical protein
MKKILIILIISMFVAGCSAEWYEHEGRGNSIYSSGIIPLSCPLKPIKIRSNPFSEKPTKKGGSAEPFDFVEAI